MSNMSNLINRVELECFKIVSVIQLARAVNITKCRAPLLMYYDVCLLAYVLIPLMLLELGVRKNRNRTEIAKNRIKSIQLTKTELN